MVKEMKKILHKTMTLEEFEKNYWYLKEIREFGVSLGIADAKKLRKDQLEAMIKEFLVSGIIPTAPFVKKKIGPKDSASKLTLTLPVIRFTFDYLTLNFLESEIAKKNSDLKAKSGEKYWIARWLEEKQKTN